MRSGTGQEEEVVVNLWIGQLKLNGTFFYLHILCIPDFRHELPNSMLKQTTVHCWQRHKLIDMTCNKNEIDELLTILWSDGQIS